MCLPATGHPISSLPSRQSGWPSQRSEPDRHWSSHLNSLGSQTIDGKEKTEHHNPSNDESTRRVHPSFLQFITLMQDKTLLHRPATLFIIHQRRPIHCATGKRIFAQRFLLCGHKLKKRRPIPLISSSNFLTEWRRQSRRCCGCGGCGGRRSCCGRRCRFRSGGQQRAIDFVVAVGAVASAVALLDVANRLAADARENNVSAAFDHFRVHHSCKKKTTTKMRTRL